MDKNPSLKVLDRLILVYRDYQTLPWLDANLCFNDSVKNISLRIFGSKKKERSKQKKKKLIELIFFSKDHLRSISLLYEQDVGRTDIDVMDTYSYEVNKKSGIIFYF